MVALLLDGMAVDCELSRDSKTPLVVFGVKKVVYLKAVRRRV
jgi:hypothetical protein